MLAVLTERSQSRHVVHVSLAVIAEQNLVVVSLQLDENPAARLTVAQRDHAHLTRLLEAQVARRRGSFKTHAR